MEILVQIRRIVVTLRGRTDLTTEAGRSRERYRRAMLTTASTVVARVLTLGTMLVSVPLTVRYLGNERYALWMILSSVIAMLGFTDLGIGNGLMNAIAASHGKDDRRAAARAISSAAVVLLALGLLIEVLFLVTYRVVPWARLLNVTSPLAMREAGQTAFVVFTVFAFSLPLGLVQRVQMGYQDGFRNHLWGALGSLLGLAGVLLAIHFRAGLPWLVLAFAGAPVLATLLNGIVLFQYQRPWLRPAWRNAHLADARQVMNTGALFLVLQLCMMLGYHSDNLVIAHVLGADKVTQYAVPMKLFALAPTVIAAVLAPLWPAYGEAISRGDTGWVLRTLKRSFLLGACLVLPVNLFLMFAGRFVLNVWVGPQIAPTSTLLVGLALWAILLGGIFHPLVMFLNGINEIRFQAACASVMAVSNLALSIFLTARIGVAGVVYGTIVTQVLFILIPMAVFVPRLLASMRSRRMAATPASAMAAQV